MTKKGRIRALLESIETGDPEPVAVANEAKCIQHNPRTQEGSEGLAALFQRLDRTSPRTNVVRAFEDGDFVFAHTEYDFASRKVGFEVFRFENGQTVAHWDTTEKIAPRSERRNDNDQCRGEPCVPRRRPGRGPWHRDSVTQSRHSKRCEAF